MKAKLITLGILAITATLVFACAPETYEELSVSAVSPKALPLVEYSFKQEEWVPMTEGEEIRIQGDIIHLRLTECGKPFILGTKEVMMAPRSSRLPEENIKKEGFVITLTGKGQIFVTLKRYCRTTYAKIILLGE